MGNIGLSIEQMILNSTTLEREGIAKNELFKAYLMAQVNAQPLDLKPVGMLMTFHEVVTSFCLKKGLSQHPFH